MVRFGLPSKGRLKKQVEKFFSEKGLELVNVGMKREYLAEFKGEKKVQIILLAASDIPLEIKKGNLDIGSLDLSGSITSVDGSAPTNGQILMGHTGNGDMQLGTLTAGEGIDVTNGAGSITLSAEDATATNKGIASFNASEFTVSSGAVSITAIDGGSY